MIMNVKGLMQAEWLTEDGWLFELYTISNILYQAPWGPRLRLHLLPACRLQRRGPAACINHPYRIQHLGLGLHSAPFSSLLLISDEIPSPLCSDALGLGAAASGTGWWWYSLSECHCNVRSHLNEQAFTYREKTGRLIIGESTRPKMIFITEKMSEDK